MIKINKFIRSRRRTLSLTVTADAELIVKAPLAMPSKIINDFISKKINWIEKRLNIAKIKKLDNPPKIFTEGEKFFYLGKQYNLKITENKKITLSNFLEFPKKALPLAKKHLTKWYKRQAKKIITERLKLYAHFADLKYTSIKITSAKKRFGSCSGKNTLNFSWRLIIAPLGAIDYVVAHELAHIQVKNHSKKFWLKVKDIMPGYKYYHVWLNKNGHILTI